MADLLFILCDSAILLMLNQFYLLGQTQISQTGGQSFSDTSPYGECSLANVYFSILLSRLKFATRSSTIF